MMTDNPLPSLPPEVWRMALEEFRKPGSLDDLIWLWDGRHVSKWFLEVIENIFKTEHLPKTKLKIRIAVPEDSDQTTEHFYFYGIADNKTRALFKYEPYVVNLPDGFRTEVPFGELLFRGLRELQLRDSLLFAIHVGSAVNDTGLPDLQIDLERQEISCSWVGLFVRLFGEQKAAQKAGENCPSDAFAQQLITPLGQAWAEARLGFVPHWYLNKWDICLLIAQRGRH